MPAPHFVTFEPCLSGIPSPVGDGSLAVFFEGWSRFSVWGGCDDREDATTQRVGRVFKMGLYFFEVNFPCNIGNPNLPKKHQFLTGSQDRQDKI